MVDTAYHMAGATAVFSANKFERRFRDMHAIAQQIQGRDTHYEDAGKAILSGNLDTPPTAVNEFRSVVLRTGRRPPVVKQFMKSLTEPSPLELPYVSCSRFARSPFA